MPFFLTYRAHYFATEQAALLWRASWFFWSAFLPAPRPSAEVIDLAEYRKRAG